jgi:hypothetical protein
MTDPVIDWPQEEIPNEDDLYLRALVKSFLDGQPSPSCFLAHASTPQEEKGLSTDWRKYRTPQETRAAGKTKGPEHYGVLALLAGSVRAIRGLTIEHSPDAENDNRAHTDIWGLDRRFIDEDQAIDVTELRHELVLIARVVIAPGAPI